MSLERRAGATIGVVWLVAGVAYFAVPGWRQAIIGEDRVLEMGTTIVLLAALPIALIHLRGTSEIPSPADRVAVRVIPILISIAILDELSFGVRIFGFDPPVVEGANLDGVHDLVLIAGLFVSHRTSTAVTLLVAAVAVAAGFAFLYWALRTSVVRRIMRLRSTRFVIAAFACAAAATLIDLDVMAIPHRTLWEELLETSGAVLLLYSAVALKEGVSVGVERTTPA